MAPAYLESISEIFGKTHAQVKASTPAAATVAAAAANGEHSSSGASATAGALDSAQSDQSNTSSAVTMATKEVPVMSHGVVRNSLLRVRARHDALTKNRALKQKIEDCQGLLTSRVEKLPPIPISPGPEAGAGAGAGAASPGGAPEYAFVCKWDVQTRGMLVELDDLSAAWAVAETKYMSHLTNVDKKLQSLTDLAPVTHKEAFADVLASVASVFPSSCRNGDIAALRRMLSTERTRLRSKEKKEKMKGEGGEGATSAATAATAAASPSPGTMKSGSGSSAQNAHTTGPADVGTSNSNSSSGVSMAKSPKTSGATPRAMSSKQSPSVSSSASSELAHTNASKTDLSLSSSSSSSSSVTGCPTTGSNSRDESVDLDLGFRHPVRAEKKAFPQAPTFDLAHFALPS
jgi:hypothetical protein